MFVAYHVLVFYPLPILPFISARPLSIPQSNDGDSSMPWLITACLVSFLVLLTLLTVKLVYMRRRRLSAIRSQSLQSKVPLDVLSNTSSLFSEVKATPSHSALLAFLVGYLGSPSCETDRKLALDKHLSNQRRTASLMYRLRREPKYRSSTSYSVVCNSSNSLSVTSPAQVAPSIFSVTPSSEHSIEVATDFWPPPSADLEVLAHPTKVWPRTVTTVASKRCSLLIDHPYCGQLGDFSEKLDHDSSSFGPHIQSDWTTTVVDYAPTSLRLVGASVTAVPYSFLYAFPPSSHTLAPAPLTGTRDSLQLARTHPKLARKPVPSLPPLPTYTPSSGKGPSGVSLSDSIPSLLPSTSIGSVSTVADEESAHMNPLGTGNPATVEVTPPVSTSPTGTFTSCKLLRRVTDPADPPLVFAAHKMIAKKKNRRSCAARSRSGVIPGASPLRIVVFQEEMTDRMPIVDTPLCRKGGSTIDAGQMAQNTSYRFYPILGPTSHSDTGFRSRRVSQLLNEPSAACSAESMQSLDHSDVEGSLSDLSTLQTPKFDHLDEVDIGMLGLDRFRWPEDGEDFMQSHSSDIKSDSVAVTSFWEEGQWAEDSYSW